MLAILARATGFKRPLFSVDVSVFVCVSGTLMLNNYLGN